MGEGENPARPADALDAFAPDAALVEWAAGALPGIDPLDTGILGAFRDHHRARGTKLTDIPAAYRNWLRKEPKFGDHLSSEPLPRQGEILMPFRGGKSPRQRRASMVETALAEAMKEEWGT